METDVSISKNDAPVVASYLATFLKPEMLHVYRQITALKKWQPVVFCQKRENTEKFPFQNVRIFSKPATHQLRRFWQRTVLEQPIQIYASEAARLDEALQASGAKLLHIYFGHIGVHLLPLIERTKLPVVVSFHGADAQVDLEKPKYLAEIRRVFQLARLILVRSESIGRRLMETGCPLEKIRIQRTGIPLESFPVHKREIPKDGAWRFFQAGRLIAKKGYETSLRAFAVFTKKYPDSSFTIAGEGPLREEIRAFVRQLGVERHVVLGGFLTEHALRKFYAESHFFLHPSQLGPDGDQEGVPNAILEAMATGLPVAATRHGGIPEIIEQGRNGLLVAERDHEALAGELLALAENPPRYQRISDAAAGSVRKHFDIEKTAQRLEEIYDEAL